jgi:DNA-binding GntR family transcriptional regulator
VEHCGHQRLIETLAGLKELVRRYESIYMQDSSLVRGSVRDHSEILEVLAKKRPNLAGRLFEQHSRAGMESILRRLDELGQAEAEKLYPIERSTPCDALAC